MQPTSLLILFLLTLFLTACGELSPLSNEQSRNENVIDENPINETASDAPASSTIPISKTKQLTHMYIGTGGVQGAYFPIGGVICRLLNRHTSVHRIRCTLESTGGSIHNLRELRKGNFELAFAQSDWQYNAYHGLSTFKKEQANKDLRAVFALEADPLTLIVNSKSDITEFSQLKDRVVSFGYTRSLQHRVMDDFLQAKNISNDYFKKVSLIRDSRQAQELCDGDVEAVLLLSSSLNDRLRDLPDDCELRLVALEGPEIDSVIEQKPYYRKAEVPNNGRFVNDEVVMSFGVGASFVANKDSSPKAIYHVVKEVVENFKDFKSLHPSLAQLKKKELPYAGISIPLHPGAVRYYKEARLLK